jgi:hypothetical protein
VDKLAKRALVHSAKYYYYTKMRWTGHAERVQKYIKAYKIVVKNSEVKRPLRIPWGSWAR